ncbi:MAG: hypothetical protein MOGMAGMI_00717 [Candidatus Omnitrophica bacterium]|nr:hypothetical protein [Candidatus Omnitrophota bacterium]
MKNVISNETKTGALVLVSILLLTGLVLKVGNFKFFQEGYLLRTRFMYSAGVKKHAPVRLSGVDVGEVKDIRIIYGDQTLVELDLWFEEGVKVRKDSKANVSTLGMMGEKYIEIRVGTPQAEYALPNELIEGVEPVRLEDLLEMGTKVAEDIGQTARDVSTLTRNIDGTLTEQKPRIGRIFANLEDTSVNFKDFSEDIKWHPWKLLMKGKERKKEEMSPAPVDTGLSSEQAASKNNFGPRR